jgi:nucleoside phosphorylase
MSSPADYSIGWICAVHVEYVAARVFLDEQHDPLERQDPNDENVYTLGRIGRHNVAIACLPRGMYGLINAAHVAKDMLRTFNNIRIGLMVGIGGGAPTAKHDIRLGDIVVGTVEGADGAVLQYDFGKTIQEKQFQMTRHLDAPPSLLSGAVNHLSSTHEIYGHTIDQQIANIVSANNRLKKKYQKPESTSDLLYKSSFVHNETAESEDCRTTCGIRADDLVTRPERSDQESGPQIHYGLIASGNQVMKDAKVRSHRDGKPTKLMSMDS